MNPWMVVFESPLGPLSAAADRAGRIVYLGFRDHEPRARLLYRLRERRRELQAPGAVLDALGRELEEHFHGTRRAFSLPLAPAGTPFQQRVWAALREIPWGCALTYGAMARSLGSPGLARAVGAANGANPISILIPCHRLVGSGGDLTGYAGGLARKEALLRLEGHARWPLTVED